MATLVPRSTRPPSRPPGAAPASAARSSTSCSSTTTRSSGRACARSSSARTTCGSSARPPPSPRRWPSSPHPTPRRAARPQAVDVRRRWTGWTCARRWPRAHPEVAVLVLHHVPRRSAGPRRRCSAGARGYVVKEVDTSELVRAIRAVSTGRERLRRPQRVGDGARAQRGPGAPTVAQLTARETEVLRLLARGLSNRDIGRGSSSPRPRRSSTSATSCASSRSAGAPRRSTPPARWASSEGRPRHRAVGPQRAAPRRRGPGRPASCRCRRVVQAPAGHAAAGRVRDPPSWSGRPPARAPSTSPGR